LNFEDKTGVSISLPVHVLQHRKHIRIVAAKFVSAASSSSRTLFDRLSEEHEADDRSDAVAASYGGLMFGWTQKF
jgi:hypothetical protein